MIPGEFGAQSATRFEADAALLLAVSQDRFKLRIALEAFGHVAHGRPRSAVTGSARLILAQAGPFELLSALHEAVSAALRLSFELERLDGAVHLARASLTGKAGSFT